MRRRIFCVKFKSIVMYFTLNLCFSAIQALIAVQNTSQGVYFDLQATGKTGRKNGGCKMLKETNDTKEYGNRLIRCKIVQRTAMWIRNTIASICSQSDNIDCLSRSFQNMRNTCESIQCPIFPSYPDSPSFLMSESKKPWDENPKL